MRRNKRTLVMRSSKPVLIVLNLKKVHKNVILKIRQTTKKSFLLQDEDVSTFDTLNIYIWSFGFIPQNALFFCPLYACFYA